MSPLMLGSLLAISADEGQSFRLTTCCHELQSELAAMPPSSKRDHKVTLRAHTWLIIRPFMNVMQDSAKRDLAEGVERRKPWLHRSVPESVFQGLNDSLRFASTRHHDPQCFVEIEVRSRIGHLPDLHSSHRSYTSKNPDSGQCSF